MGSLKAGIQEKYDQERASFSSDLKVRGLDIDTLPGDILDWVLAERILDLYEVSESTEGIGLGAILLAAMSRANLRHHYRTAWKALDVWRTRCPPVQAIAYPEDLAMATVSFCGVKHSRSGSDRGHKNCRQMP